MTESLRVLRSMADWLRDTYGWATEDYPSLRAYAQAINTSPGGWVDDRSAPLGGIIRREGIHLSEDDLEVVITLAETPEALGDG